MNLESHGPVTVIRNFLNSTQQESLFKKCENNFNTDPLKSDSFTIFYAEDCDLDTILKIQQTFSRAYQYIQLNQKKNELSKEQESFDVRYIESRGIEILDPNYYNSAANNNRLIAKVYILGVSYFWGITSSQTHLDEWSDLIMTISFGVPCNFCFSKEKDTSFKEIYLKSGDLAFFPGNQVYHHVKFDKNAKLPKWCQRYSHFQEYSRFNLQLCNMPSPPRRSLRIEEKNLQLLKELSFSSDKIEDSEDMNSVPSDQDEDSDAMKIEENKRQCTIL